MSYQQPGRARSFGNNEFSNDLAISIREIFYAYGVRRSDDNRSAQQHMGPSEIGTPCDRRLAMELLGRPYVNPGGDGYPAWLGTQGHRGMADIYEWADGGSGRFAVETKLNYPSARVPKGTGDLLDRKYRAFVDWKFMGTWSLNSLRKKGPSDTYRIQVQTYGLGAVTRGEKVEKVAIVGLPRQGTSLDEMYVWSEDFDPAVGQAALKRVEDISHQIQKVSPGWTEAQVVKSFDVEGDCRYCPFHLPGAQDINDGCNGKA